MVSLEYVLSFVTLAWLGYLALHEMRKDPPANTVWILLPLGVAALFRLAAGPALVVLVAVILVLVSDRQQLKNRLVEWMVVIAVLVAVALILISADPFVSVAGVCMLIIWLGWEFRMVGEQEAIVLITCLLIWPTVYFLLAYMAASMLWYVGIRIRKGGWRQAHPAPGLVLIAIAGLGFVLLRIAGLA